MSKSGLYSGCAGCFFAGAAAVLALARVVAAEEPASGEDSAAADSVCA